MKLEKPLTALTAGVLAVVIAAGALGCLVTAFDLPLAAPDKLALACGITALLSAGILSLRWGNPILACLMALAAGYIWQDGRAWEQTQVLLHLLTSVYSRAYGWGIAALPEGLTELTVDWPLAILGSLIVITVCSSICCRLSAVLPVAVTVLALSLCVVVTDTVPQEPWLLTVMAGLALLILTSAVRRENPWQGLRLTALAAPLVALAQTGQFLAVPQESYVNRSEVFRENILLAVKNFPQLMETGMTQITTRLQRKAPEQVNLSTLGERIPFTYPVMEVTARQSGPLYLRQQDYNEYDGLRWYSDPERTETFCGAGTATETITIHTEHLKAFRDLPYHPEGIALTGGAAENPEEDQTYTVERVLLPDNWRQRAYQAGTASEDWKEYCALPEETRQEAKAMLAGLFEETASNTEKADIIAALVTNSAVYDLNPSRMGQRVEDFALWFLREGERGYCVHFATAAAVLLRAADVPARYVSGYLVDARADQTVTVTEEDAHAWAEYYEPNLGLWLPLEATPAEEEPDTVPVPPVTEAPPASTETTEETPATEETGTETTQPTVSQPVPSMDETSPEGLPAEPEKEEPARWPLLLLLPLMAVTQRSVRLAWRTRRFRQGSPNRQALRRWQEAERLGRILKESPPPELQELALKAKFSQYTLTGEELSRFDEQISETVRRMRKHPWWRQLMYRLVYAVY